MEGLDILKPITYEIRHLSKAQRCVSREHRPIPFEPHDQVLIDTVGKLAKIFNGYQYAIIITEGKSQLRWAIFMCTEYQIATH